MVNNHGQEIRFINKYIADHDLYLKKYKESEYFI